MTPERLSELRSLAAFSGLPGYIEAVEWLERYWLLYMGNNGQDQCALINVIRAATDGKEKSSVAG